MAEDTQPANEKIPATKSTDLPAVVRPNASFFIQLFLMPALIVLGIMAVMFLFGKITSERTVDELVAVLKSNRGDRWQAAHDLAQLLGQNSKHAQDPQLALLIAQELEKSLAKKVESGDAYVEYLIGALGSFQIPTGVPALRLATKAEYPKEIRRAALLALATLADKLHGNLEDPNVAYEVRSYLKDTEADIRGASALLLGTMKDAGAESQLVAALDDPVETVGYDAANALASIGSTACVKKIVQMLDLNRKESKEVSPDQAETAEAQKFIIAVSGLRSLKKIGAKLSSENIAAVEPAVKKLTLSENNTLRVEAVEALDVISKSNSANNKGN